PGGVFVSGYGYRPSTQTFHHGVDISTRSDSNPGAAIVSADDGTVALTPDYFGGCYNYGHRIEIRHPGRGLVTTYNHLASRSVLVGQKVNRGQKIAVEGSTSCGMITHLHYEIQTGIGLRNGDFNPLKIAHEPPIR
ncbi:MAG: M23 family metallopeptidase, partial [Thermosynechococcaceae cyanobacterium]